MFKNKIVDVCVIFFFHVFNTSSEIRLGLFRVSKINESPITFSYTIYEKMDGRSTKNMVDDPIYDNEGSRRLIKMKL